MRGETTTCLYRYGIWLRMAAIPVSGYSFDAVDVSLRVGSVHKAGLNFLRGLRTIQVSIANL